MAQSDLEKRAEAWLKEPFDTETRAVVKKLLQSNLKEVENAFYTNLAFGTGGLRGIMGVGTNRINEYTIRKTTLGLAHYLKKQFPQGPISVVIGFDSRHHSKEFAIEAANVLSHHGITALLLKELRPTPYVSFACRHFKANAAIMITASHNPKEYNGYKVYWSDGAQVVPPHDTGIIQAIEEIEGFTKPFPPKKDYIQIVDDKLDDLYLETIRPLALNLKQNKDHGKDLRIAFTSLHGTGITLAPKALADWGFTHFTPVEKQVIVDGDFPTVKLPNPEDLEALKLGSELLIEKNEDILLATDPDADRLAVVVHHKGSAIRLTGNETASICMKYLCETLQSKKALPPNPAFITTIVSSDLMDAICSSYKIPCLRVLTGFKYIGEKIHEWEANHQHSFIFGAEESYGYLLGTHSRDKDAIVSCCLIAEIALHLKKQGKTLIDYLNELYQNYGVFRESQISLEFAPGKEGMESLTSVMNNLRQSPPSHILGKKVIKVEDYLPGLHSLPKADVLLFQLEDGLKLIVRPSGTEPKVKVYGGIHICYQNNLANEIQAADLELIRFLKQFKQALLP